MIIDIIIGLVFCLFFTVPVIIFDSSSLDFLIDSSKKFTDNKA